MTCRDSSLLISAHLDGQADARQEQQLWAHLSECSVCRSRAAELRCLSEDLQLLGGRLPSAKMTTEIVAALQQEAKLQKRAARRRADLRDIWRMRIFSQSIGTVVSFAMFLFLVAIVIKPIYQTVSRTRVVEAAVIVTTDYTDSAEKLRQLRHVLLPPQPNSPQPVFDPGRVLLGFSQSLEADDEFVVTVKVGEDGRASVKKAVEPPRDPAVLTNLSNALFEDVSFQPAGRRGRFVRSNAVLMFSKVNVPG